MNDMRVFGRIANALKTLAKFCGLIAACSWVTGCVTHPPQKIHRWAAYYGASEPWESFAHLELVVFDSDKHPPITPLKERGVKVLAYLSVAEIAPYREFAESMLKLPDFVIGHQERWNSSIVDIRNQLWREHILEVQISKILSQGFDGVMIDTVDSALSKAAEDPIRFVGMKTSTIQLLQQIRQVLPTSSIIMVNRGFEIAPEIAADIDILLAESILVDAREEDHKYFPEEIYQSYVDGLQQLWQKNANLSIFTLDYLSINDMNARNNIECMQREHGFSPYVAMLDLQHFKPASNKQC